MKDLLIRIRALFDGSGADQATDALEDVSRAADRADASTKGNADGLKKMSGATADASKESRGLAERLRSVPVIGGAIAASLAAAAAAIFTLARAMSSAVAEGVRYNAMLEMGEQRFRTLLGSAEDAADRVQELKAFAAETPFQFGELQDASATLQTLTGDALSTGNGLRLVGDAAAVANAPIGELAVSVGRLFDGIRSGQAVGEPLARLQELGVISGEVRRKVEQLQDANASSAEVWAVVEGALRKHEGAMQGMSRTWDGLISTLNDNIAALKGTAAEPLFEQLKGDLEQLIGFLSSPEIQGGFNMLGHGIGFASEKAREAAPYVKEFVDALPVLGTRLDVAGKALSDLFQTQEWANAAAQEGWTAQFEAIGKMAGEMQNAEDRARVFKSVVEQISDLQKERRENPDRSAMIDAEISRYEKLVQVINKSGDAIIKKNQAEADAEAARKRLESLTPEDAAWATETHTAALEALTKAAGDAAEAVRKETSALEDQASHAQDLAQLHRDLALEKLEADPTLGAEESARRRAEIEAKYAKQSLAAEEELAKKKAEVMRKAAEEAAQDAADARERVEKVRREKRLADERAAEDATHGAAAEAAGLLLKNLEEQLRIREEIEQSTAEAATEQVQRSEEELAQLREKQGLEQQIAELKGKQAIEAGKTADAAEREAKARDSTGRTGVHKGTGGETYRNADGTLADGINQSRLGTYDGPDRLDQMEGPGWGGESPQAAPPAATPAPQIATAPPAPAPTAAPQVGQTPSSAGGSGTSTGEVPDAAGAVDAMSGQVVEALGKVATAAEDATGNITDAVETVRVTIEEGATTNGEKIDAVATAASEAANQLQAALSLVEQSMADGASNVESAVQAMGSAVEAGFARINARLNSIEARIRNSA